MSDCCCSWGTLECLNVLPAVAEGDSCVLMWLWGTKSFTCHCFVCLHSGQQANKPLSFQDHLLSVYLLTPNFPLLPVGQTKLIWWFNSGIIYSNSSTVAVQSWHKVGQVRLPKKYIQIIELLTFELTISNGNVRDVKTNRIYIHIYCLTTPAQSYSGAEQLLWSSFWSWLYRCSLPANKNKAQWVAAS